MRKPWAFVHEDERPVLTVLKNILEEELCI